MTFVEVQIAVAKVSKYASLESGDTLEVVERPTGGLSVVLADGQTSGHGAKAVSLKVVRTVVGLLADGVRDGAAARAASDALYADKQGKVISTLNIASIDLQSRTVVLARNNPAPSYVVRGGKLDVLDSPSEVLGLSRNVRPSMTELPLEPGLWIVIHTDGLSHAGSRRGRPMDVPAAIRLFTQDQDHDPQALADLLLAQAVQLDDNRPSDDVSILVLKVSSKTGDEVRRMTVRLPLQPVRT
jgi:serine phosphatase RsbU (regulator of sigma subunit)